MILFLGAYPKPITGQSLAMEYAFENYNGEKKIIKITGEKVPDIFKIFKNIFLIFFEIPFNIFFYQPNVVYISASLNTCSSLRDITMILLAKLIGSKAILHLHNSMFENLVTKHTFLIPFYKWVYGNVDLFITPTIQLLRQIKPFIKNAEVIEVPYFYEPILENIAPHLKKQNSNKKIKLLFLSNLIYSKGIIDLLNVFKKISSEHPNIELHIAGEYMSDEYKGLDELKNLIIPFLESKQINFHGVVKGESKKKLFEQCDIFILPTFYAPELFPISIVEAMRAGLAVITTEHNDLKKIYPPSVVFVEKRNPKALSSAIKNLMQNSALLNDIKIANMEYAKEKYSLKNYTRKINKCIRQLDVQYIPLSISYRKDNTKVVPEFLESPKLREVAEIVHTFQ